MARAAAARASMAAARAEAIAHAANDRLHTARAVKRGRRKDKKAALPTQQCQIFTSILREVYC
jgi:hypothetical protein